MSEINFWQQLKAKQRPILALAPMAGFTDIAFRQICCTYGADVSYSEMASATALYYRQGREETETIKLLQWDPIKENKYVVQLFGSDPLHFAKAAKIITSEIRPHGLDINFGCPAGKVLKQGAGAELMADLKKARSVVESVLESTDLPVSVKIRAASGSVTSEDFIRNISDLPVSAVMIHGRTLKQAFIGQPDFPAMRLLKNYFSGIILANGGVNDLRFAKQALELSGADGLGLARGALARPWLFREIKEGREIEYGRDKIIELLWKHASLLASLKGEQSLLEWRKQACWYVQAWPGASQLRSRLVQVSTLDQLKMILQDYGLNDRY